MRWLLAWFSVLVAFFAFSIPTAFAQDPPKKDPPPDTHPEAHPDKKDAPPSAHPENKDPPPDAHPQKKDKDAEEEDEERDAPIKYKVGVQLESISGFDAAKGTYSAEFILFLRCDREPCKPHIDAVNAKGNLGKPEVIHSEKLFKVYKYKAELNALVDLSSFPFDEHVLPIVLEDKADPDDVTWELDKETTDFDRDKCKLPAFEPDHWVAAVIKDDIGGGQHINQLRFGLQIRRSKFLGFMSNLLPPLVMAVFIMGASLFMKPKAAQARLGGISGSLLAVVMFHKGAIPPGAPLTLLDKFMIVTYFVYVVNILLTVVMLRAEDQKKEQRGEIAYLVAWGAVPGFALLAWTLVFSGLV